MKAIAGLTVRQGRFVEAYVRTGGKNATRCAIEAGYGSRGAGNSAYRLLKYPAVIEAIRRETERFFRANAPVAAETIFALAKNAKSEAVRLQAATTWLDRAGMLIVAKSEHRHIVEDLRTEAELQDKIIHLARELGLTAKVIDGHLVADLVPSLPVPAAHADPARHDDDADPFS